MSDQPINDLVDEYFYRGYEWETIGVRLLPPLLPMVVMIQCNAEMRKMFPNGIPNEQERLAAKVSEEFVL